MVVNVTFFAGMDGSSSALPVLPSLFAAVAFESFGDIPVATGRLAKRTLCIDGWTNGCVRAACLQQRCVTKISAFCAIIRSAF
jgi:hypothetical protein